MSVCRPGETCSYRLVSSDDAGITWSGVAVSNIVKKESPYRKPATSGSPSPLNVNVPGCHGPPLGGLGSAGRGDQSGAAGGWLMGRVAPAARRSLARAVLAPPRRPRCGVLSPNGHLRRCHRQETERWYRHLDAILDNDEAAETA
jgi:hypothetical protein